MFGSRPLAQKPRPQARRGPLGSSLPMLLGSGCTGGGSGALVAAQKAVPGHVGHQRHATPLGQRRLLNGGLSGEQTAQQPADEGGEVALFLQKAGLQMYAPAFLQSGFDELETLCDMEDADMKDLGMLPHHMAVLRRRLQHLRGHGADHGQKVLQFLESVSLGQYAPTLLQHGFDDMETLLEISEADMKDVCIPRGHALKLKKRLHEYQLRQLEQDPPASLHTSQSSSQRQLPSSGGGGGGAAFAATSLWAHPRGSADRTGVPAAGSLLGALPSEQMKSAVSQSWEQVQILGAHTVGELLYQHTFALAPDATGLFTPEVLAKYRLWVDGERDEGDEAALRNLFSKVVNAVGCTVAGLHDFTTLVPMLKKLGARHMGYGVKEVHWQILGKALDLTLKDILGEVYKAEVQSAWKMVYGFMSCIMVEGLQNATQAAALGTKQGSTHEERLADGFLRKTARRSRVGSAEDTASLVSCSTVDHRSASEIGEDLAPTPSSMRSS